MKLTIHQKDEIKSLIQKCFSIPQIVNKLKLSVNDVCEFVDCPNDMNEMIKRHKDFCFYDHGLGESGLDERFEDYSLFLNEGDFEKWQPVCYMKHDEPEFIKLKKEADSLINSFPDKSYEWLREEVRINWIILRFFDFYEVNRGRFSSRKFCVSQNNLKDYLNR